MHWVLTTYLTGTVKGVSSAVRGHTTDIDGEMLMTSILWRLSTSARLRGSVVVAIVFAIGLGAGYTPSSVGLDKEQAAACS